MELFWKEIEAERLIRRKTAQVRVEGELPSPDGRIPTEVLSCSADVKIDKSTVDTDEVRVEGSVNVRLIVTDEEGKPFSYESSAGFTHLFAAEGASPGMTAEVIPCIQSISAQPEGRTVKLSANVDIEVCVVSGIPFKVTGGVSGVRDLEVKELSRTHRRRRGLYEKKLILREELACEDAEDIIGSDGTIVIKDISFEQDRASVSGLITVSAVTVDKEGNIGQLLRQVPFRESFAIESTGGNAECEAALERIYLHALGEDFGLISMEAEVSFRFFETEVSAIKLPVDAFSPSISFDCLKESINIRDFLGTVSAQTAIKETVSLPDGAPDIASPMFAYASVVITEALPYENVLNISGVLITTAVYKSGAGLNKIMTEDIPFSTSLDIPAGVTRANADIGAVVQTVGNTERSIQLQYQLAVSARLYHEEECEAAAGLAEKEREDGINGILISFASEGETVFDIAKRCSVPCETVRKLNPEVKEPFREGDKLLLIT